MTRTLRPLHDRILVERARKSKTTKGGLHIPDSAREKPIEGFVVQVGRGTVNEDGEIRPLDVHAGDRILFGKYSGTEIELGGKKYLILREDEVLGIIES